MSGGGRCNFTNLYIEPDCFLSANPHFCKSALTQYTQWDFIDLVNRHGVPYHEKKLGQLFCDHSAKDILALLLAECEQAGVEILTECEVNAIDYTTHYQLLTSQGQWAAESLVIATGGLSIPTMGATGFGYQVAEQFGMTVLPTRASLVPFTLSDALKSVSETLTGVAVDTIVSSNGTAFQENTLFTHRGLSGPAMLQVSNYWRSGDTVHIDLLAGQHVESMLLGFKQDSPKSLLRNLLGQQLPKRLVAELEHLWWPQLADKPLADWPDKQLLELAGKLSDWVIKPAGTEGYRTAEVTQGGVDTDRLSSKTMACKDQLSLFFIGEVVDVTGHLGGFNFQWAWSSGYVAGMNV